MHNSKLDHSIITTFPYDAYLQIPHAFKPSLTLTLLKTLIDRQCQNDGTPCAKNGISFDACANLLQSDPTLRDTLLRGWKAGSFDNFRRLESFQLLISDNPADSDAGSTPILATSATTNLQNASINGALITTVGRDQHNYTTSQVDRQREIANWISKLDFLPIQQETIKKRTPLTGQWLLDSPTFKEWHDASDSAVLWCSGLPGAGKTVQTSIVIDYLERNSIVCYIYFSYKTQKDLQHQDAIFSLLRQLYVLQPALFHDLEEIYNSHREGRLSLSPEVAHKLLTDALSAYKGCIHIVLDALDEYQAEFHVGNIEKLIQSILSLGKKTKLMVTSREMGKIHQIFNPSLWYSLKIAASSSDIKLHIKHFIDHNESFRRRLIGKLLQEVIEKVSAVSGIRFLLAQLHLESLSRLPLPRDIDDALKSLSTDIDPAYEQVVERIEQQEPWRHELAVKILCWITYAYRKLTLKELQHALAVQPNRKIIDEYDIHLESTIISVCAGLVVVEEESETVRFTHKTTQEFFAQRRGPLLSHAHHRITRTCLAYLSLDFPLKSIAGMHPWEAQKYFKEYVLFQYAAEYWPQHLNQYCEDADSESLLIPIINRQNGVLLRLKFSNHSGNILHFLCVKGYTNALATILKHCTHVIQTDSKDDDDRTPLSHAAEHGHTSTVELLLKRQDVMADSESKSHRTPLSFAAEKRHEPVIRLLFEHGAAGDSKDSKGRTPLSYLVAPETNWLSWIYDFLYSLLFSEPSTSLTVISIFLEQDDVDVNAKDNRGRTPLSYAAEKGNIAFVKVILNHHKTIPDLPDNTGKTPCDYAQARRHKNIVALLQERKSNRTTEALVDKATLELESGNDKGKGWRKTVYIVIVFVFVLLSVSVHVWARRKRANQEAAKKQEEEATDVKTNEALEVAVSVKEEDEAMVPDMRTLALLVFVFFLAIFVFVFFLDIRISRFGSGV